METLEVEDVVTKILESEGMIRDDQMIFDMEVEVEYREIDGKIKTYLCGEVNFANHDAEGTTCDFTIDLNENKVVGFDQV